MTVLNGSSVARWAAAVYAVALAAFAGEAWAAASAWDRTDVSEVRLVAAQDAVGDGSVSLGLQIRLAPTWKTYWRTPGEAGFPPRIDWSGSSNLAGAEMSWPAPRRFLEIGDLVTHGYMDEVVFPIAARAVDPGAPLVLHAVVDYPACQEICYPFQATLALELPPGAAGPSVFSGLVARFLARVPGPPRAGGPAIEAAEAAGDGADRLVRVVARAPGGFSAPDLFVEGPPSFYFGPPKVELRAAGAVAVFRMAAPVPRDRAPLVGAPLVFTLIDGGEAFEQTVAVVPGVAEAPALAALFAILALAFAGGLILNLMPCVLPVLSLKIIGVVGLGGAARGAVTERFLAAAAGILASFLVLAAGVSGLKAAGMAVGWGVQFQEPLFLIGLIIVITLFACNLWELFQIPLPAWFGGGGAGSGAESKGVAGHFASGAFATLLATPCSAPFLGTAVGFALARGTGEIFAVFAALGLGMAAPFLLVAAFPGMAAHLPRPGRWMVTMRRVLALLLAATAVWLLTILAAQSGHRAALAVGALMIAAAFVVGFASDGGRRRRFAATAVLASIFALAFVAPAQLGRAVAAAPEADALWQPFDRAAIPGLIAAGKTVFVDVTADWCVTCKFNKATVLDRGAVAGRLAADQVIAMRADWTSPDPAIAGYLEDFGRFGIPFNAVYGPALPRGFALPELLTEEAVLRALDRAGRTAASTD